MLEYRQPKLIKKKENKMNEEKNQNQTILPFDVKLCVMYVRVSSDDQRDGFSIPAQIELLVSYAKENNLRIVRIFEESMSAKDSGRIEFNRMLKYLKNHPEVRTILVEKTDRLYRNFKDYAVLDDSKYEIHLVKENEILSKDSTSHQKLIHGLKVLLAKNFIDNLREETYKGRKKKAEEGYIVGGAPYGYRKINKNEAEPIPEEAFFIQQAYNLYLEGRSLAGVREELMRRGIIYRPKTPAISRGHLHRLLSNAYYTGRVPFEGEMFPGKFQAIVSIDTYDKVQVMLKKEKEYLYDYIFGGVMRCARCGSVITVEKRKEKYIYYHCTGGNRHCRQRSIHLSEAYVVRAFQRALDKIKITEEKRFWLRTQLQSEMSAVKVINADGKDQAERDLEKIYQFMDDLYNDKLNGKITADFWERKNADLKLKADETKARLDSMTITRQGNVVDCMRKIDNIGLLPKMFKEGGFSIQRDIAKMVFSKVILKGRILNFTYAYPFNYFVVEKDDKVDENESGYYD